MDSTARQDLAARTRERSALTWLSLDYGGLMTPLAAVENDLNSMALPSGENFLAISDESFGIKEEQRDRTIELSQAEIDQEVALADAKASASRAKIAIEKAADEYVLAAKVYDARVKSLIMGAREYAGLVEREQLANEAARAGLAVDQEALKLAKTQAEIYLEVIQKAQVQADLAKSQVEVAKAHVRAALSGIEAGEAEIKLIEAQTEQYIAEAEKATLQADVASIYAEILTKQLTATKLGVGQAEITAGYNYIRSKLDDTLALYETRSLIDVIRTQAETELKAEVGALLSVEEAEHDLRNLEADYAQLILAHEETETVSTLDQEATLKNKLVAARMKLSDARRAQTEGRESAQTSAAQLISGAHAATYSNAIHNTTTEHRETEFISG